MESARSRRLIKLHHTTHAVWCNAGAEEEQEAAAAQLQADAAAVARQAGQHD